MGVGHGINRADSPLTELPYMAKVMGCHSHNDVILYKNECDLRESLTGLGEVKFHIVRATVR